MAGQGSTGNVIAAICSFFLPGLGQLVQGRPVMALIHFLLITILVLTVIGWWLFGWIVHIWSCLDAAWYQPPQEEFDRFD